MKTEHHTVLLTHPHPISVPTGWAPGREGLRRGLFRGFWFKTPRLCNRLTGTIILKKKKKRNMNQCKLNMFFFCIFYLVKVHRHDFLKRKLGYLDKRWLVTWVKRWVSKLDMTHSSKAIAELLSHFHTLDFLFITLHILNHPAYKAYFKRLAAFHDT